MFPLLLLSVHVETEKLKSLSHLSQQRQLDERSRADLEAFLILAANVRKEETVALLLELSVLWLKQSRQMMIFEHEQMVASCQVVTSVHE
jgi:hypothetical protein